MRRRGYGGTMKFAFFPKKVEDVIVTMGYMKSKKGKYYKKYEDGKEEFIAMPSCREVDGEKRISWYIFTTEPRRKLLTLEAREISPEFDSDGTEIETMIREVE